MENKDSKPILLKKEVHEQIMGLRGWKGCLSANDVVKELLKELDKIIQSWKKN